MGTKAIRFGLSEKEISRAIKELDDYRKELLRKTNLLRERIAEKIADHSRSAFAGAVVDDLVKGGQRYAQVDVTVENSDNISVVIASGEDAIWVEFGAGVYHNSPAGGSPHPKGAELGFTIGGYEKGMGRKAVWGFYEDGELKLTRGTPAVMPMYNAVKTVCDNIHEIAREVFS